MSSSVEIKEDEIALIFGDGALQVFVHPALTKDRVLNHTPGHLITPMKFIYALQHYPDKIEEALDLLELAYESTRPSEEEDGEKQVEDYINREGS